MSPRRIGFDVGDYYEPAQVGNGFISGADYLDAPPKAARLADYRPAVAHRATIADYVPKKAAT